jgi:tripartite-type tricarboxylate transporter receptor subunit TctC
MERIKGVFMSLKATVSTRRALGALCMAVLSCVAAPAAAQSTYPSKPIRIVIPFGAGGVTDVVGRLVGQKLGEELRQPVFVENRTGASGGIGAKFVAQSAPDGYTLMFGTVGTQVVNKMLYAKLPYDPAGLTPVSLVANSPFMLAVGDIPGVTDLKSLAAYASANPGKLNFGSAGNGSSPHLGIELFKLATGTFIVHIPFRSGVEAVVAALSGQVQIVIDAIPIVSPHTKSGKLKALAMADDKRAATMPDLKTSTEQGMAAFQIGSWNALVAPAATPQAEIDILNAALVKVMARPEVISQLASLGVEPMPLGPAAYVAHVKTETDKWSRVIKAAGTRLD